MNSVIMHSIHWSIRSFASSGHILNTRSENNERNSSIWYKSLLFIPLSLQIMMKQIQLTVNLPKIARKQLSCTKFTADMLCVYIGFTRGFPEKSPYGCAENGRVHFYSEKGGTACDVHVIPTSVFLRGCGIGFELGSNLSLMHVRM